MSGRTTMGEAAIGVRAALAVALLVATISWDAGAQAQQQGEVARLKSVTGNVLVSRESGLATGAQAERLVNGTRIITTANSEAVVEFDNGCEVRLKENERFDVDSTRACALLAGQPLGVPVAAVESSLAGYVLAVIPPLMILDEVTQPTLPVSPN